MPQELLETLAEETGGRSYLNASALLSFDESDGKQQAVVDVLGVALDDRGQFSSFRQNSISRAKS